MNNHNSSETQISQQVSHDQISRRAAELWRQSGSPQGRDVEIWLEAERQLRGTPFDLSSSSSSNETAAPFSSSSSAPISQFSEEKSDARQTELMEKKTAPASKTARNKSKSSGK